MFWCHRAQILLQHPPLANSGFAKNQAVLGKLQSHKPLAFLAACAHVEAAGAAGKAITAGEKELGISCGCRTHCTLKGIKSTSKAGRRAHSICKGDLLSAN